MSIMRILKILFYSAILLIPPWLFFGKGIKQVYEATEYVCIYSLYAVLILGYIVYFIEGWKAMPKKARIYWALYYHVIKVPLFLLCYFVYLMFLAWKSIGIFGFTTDMH